MSATVNVYVDSIEVGSRFRLELSDLDRARALARLQEIHIALHPETKQGGMPGKPGGGKIAKDADSASFAAEAAASTGRSERYVREK